MSRIRSVMCLAIAASALTGLTGCGGDEKPNAAEATSSDGSTPSSDSTDAPAGAPTAPEPATTPNLDTQPATPRETKAPVAVQAPAEFDSGMTAKIVKTEGVEMKDIMPGEIAGPAVAVTVEYHNGTSAPKRIDDIVSLNYAGQEASSYQKAPAKPAPDTLGPGQNATAVYVFGVPADQRKSVTIRVSYNPTAPQVEFTGPVG